MIPAPAALLVMFVMIFVPGALVFRALQPRGHALECMATAPALSMAFTFLVGEACTVLGLPFSPLLFLLALGLVGATAFCRYRRQRGNRASPSRDHNARRAVARAAALLLAGMCLCGVTWSLGLQGVATTSPNRDSANHGLMSARVARGETMDPVRVLALDAADFDDETGRPAVAFYPLALHGEVALAHRVAGITIADGLLAGTLLFSVVVLPLGLFYMARRLIPGQPGVAGLASLLVAGIGSLPFAPMTYGEMTLIAGMAMVPATGMMIARFLTGGGGWTVGLVVGLGAVGIAATHTSEAPLVLLCSGSLVAEQLLRTRRRRFATAAARRCLGLTAVCALLFLPTAAALTGGTAERTGIDHTPIGSITSAFSSLAGVASVHQGLDFLTLLGLAGVVLCLWRRQHLGLLLMLFCMTALYVVASSVEGPLRVLTLPWYHDPVRVGYNIAIFVPLLAAIALAATGSALERVLRERVAPGRLAAWTTTTIALVLCGAALGTNASYLRAIFEQLTPTDDDALAAFSYLRTAVGPGERVLNNANNDGGLWMYAFSGVAPALTMRPPKSVLPYLIWRERSWLLENLPRVGIDRNVERLLVKHRIRFVYLNERQFKNPPYVVTIAELRSTAGLCERLAQGTSHVFEVVSGGSCPVPMQRAATHHPW